MAKSPHEMCELVWPESMDRVLVTPHAETRHANDLFGWLFTFRGWFGAVPEFGLEERYVDRIWRIEPRSPDRESAEVALLIRATQYGFVRIEVFDISPPPTAQTRAMIAAMNEHQPWMKGIPCGEGTQNQDNQDGQKGLADLAVSGTV